MLWVGTNGVSMCDPATLRCRRIPRGGRDDENTLSWSGTHAIYPSPSDPNRIWSGTVGGGLQVYDKQTGEAKRYLPSDEDSTSGPFAVAHLLEASDGALWIASMDKGLVRFDIESESFEYFSYDPTDTLGVASNHMEVVIERAIEPGILWLATLDGGLDRFDMETRTVRHYTEEDGLANKHIYGMLQDVDGNLWMSTNGGISSFDPATESFRNYGLDDGLRELEFMQNGFANGRGGMVRLSGPRSGHPDAVCFGDRFRVRHPSRQPGRGRDSGMAGGEYRPGA